MDRLALGELEALASSGLTGFLAFFLTGIAGEHTGALQDRAELRLEFLQGAGNAMPDSAGLTRNAAALDDDVDVKIAGSTGDDERLGDIALLGKRREIFGEFAFIDGDFAVAGSEVNAGAGSLSTANRVNDFLRLRHAGESFVRELIVILYVILIYQVVQQSLHGEGDGLLGFVGVGRPGVNFKFAELGAAEAAFGHHAFDSVTDEPSGVFGAHHVSGLFFAAAGKAGVVLVDFFGVFIAGQDDFFRIDDDDVVAAVEMRGVGRFVAAAQHVSDLDGQASEHLPGGVDHVPIAGDFVFFGEEGLHGSCAQSGYVLMVFCKIHAKERII